MTAFVSDPANFSDFFRDRASLGGAVRGVPLVRGEVSLFYKLDKFKAASLTKPPATMDKYNSYAEKLTQRDTNGVPLRRGFDFNWSNRNAVWMTSSTMLHQLGGNIVDEASYKATLDTTAGRRVMQYLVSYPQDQDRVAGDAGGC